MFGAEMRKRLHLSGRHIERHHGCHHEVRLLHGDATYGREQIRFVRRSNNGFIGAAQHLVEPV